MQLGETRRRYPSHTAMWPDLVVVLPPDRCGAPGLVQRLEPLFVQTFIPELAVKALDIDPASIRRTPSYAAIRLYSASIGAMYPMDECRR